MSDLLSRTEVAERLGISVRHLARLTEAGAGPSPTQIGKRLFWRLSAIEAYLAAQTMAASKDQNRKSVISTLAARAAELDGYLQRVDLLAGIVRSELAGIRSAIGAGD